MSGALKYHKPAFSNGTPFHYSEPSYLCCRLWCIGYTSGKPAANAASSNSEYFYDCDRSNSLSPGGHHYLAIYHGTHMLAV